MTKPTPAQIEAAAKAIEGNAAHWEDWELLAKLALTAAAEVEKKELGKKYGCIAVDVPAAAEVGETEIEQLKAKNARWNQQLVELNEQIGNLQDEIDATIERCAQVADRRSDIWKDERPGWKRRLHIECADIAAAIRALKSEKTGADPNLVYPGKDAGFVFPEE